MALVVLVMVDGSVVPSAPTATLRAGRVIGPATIVARMADRVGVAADGSFMAARGEQLCVASAVPGSDPPMVELAPLARCLGATNVAWDARSKTLTVAFGGPSIVRTMPPFDAGAPQVSPTTVFTPEPARPTPREVATGSPRPRRTGIPIFAPPPGATTAPRPTAL